MRLTINKLRIESISGVDFFVYLYLEKALERMKYEIEHAKTLGFVFDENASPFHATGRKDSAYIKLHLSDSTNFDDGFNFFARELTAYDTH